jgi:ABC-type multidrug transport system fused ATPase/permease subunit
VTLAITPLLLVIFYRGAVSHCPYIAREFFRLRREMYGRYLRHRLQHGVDLRDLRLEDLRAQIGLVLQKPIILPATVAENIAYGKPHANKAEIEAAAHYADASAFIEKLPQQYQTVVGDGGAHLSVGEKQRITWPARS